MISFSSSHYSEVQSFLQDSYERVQRNETLPEQSLRFLLQIHTFAKNKQFPQLLEVNELLKLEPLRNKEKSKKRKITPVASTPGEFVGAVPPAMPAPMPQASSVSVPASMFQVSSISPPAPAFVESDSYLATRLGFSGNENTNQKKEVLDKNTEDSIVSEILESSILRSQESRGEKRNEALRWEIPEDDETSVDQLNSIEMMSATILVRLKERYVGE